MELINYYLQDDRLLCIDKTLLRYEPIQISKCLGAKYYDNVVHLIWDLEEIPVDFVFPRVLKRLTFHDNFNNEVNLEGLPLTHLTFGYYFNQKISNIPESLIEINLPEAYSQPIIDKHLRRLLGL